jgi:hypothetical protein
MKTAPQNSAVQFSFVRRRKVHPGFPVFPVLSREGAEKAKQFKYQ